MSDAKTVLITGIGGYVGAALGVHLAERGHRVVGFGHATNFDALRARCGDIDLVEGDLLDRDALVQATKGVDAIVHSASFAGERACKRNMPGAVRTIVRGTRLCAEAARENAVPTFVHLSTYAVYSTFADREMPLTEESELLPDDLYGTLKAEAEWEASQTPSWILRLTNVFGRGSGIVLKTDVMGHFVRAVSEKRPIKMFGGGKQAIEFVHIDDVARVVETVVTGPAPSGTEVLNVGAGVATPICRLAEIFQAQAKAALGQDVGVIDEPAPDGEIWPDRWTSIERIQARMPWYPQRTLDEGVRELLEKSRTA